MLTTIQIEKKTLRTLQKLKDANKMQSYEGVIHLLLGKKYEGKKINVWLFRKKIDERNFGRAT